jgi:hypothetical protein
MILTDVTTWSLTHFEPVRSWSVAEDLTATEEQDGYGLIVLKVDTGRLLSDRRLSTVFSPAPGAIRTECRDDLADPLSTIYTNPSTPPIPGRRLRWPGIAVRRYLEYADWTSITEILDMNC